MAKAYFTRGLFEFLKDLSSHNNRDWFRANQERYEQHVRDPFLQLITDLGPDLKKINPRIVADPRPNRGSMMRIHRDIRFSKDKSPYKTFVAAHFWHEKGKEGAMPGFYLRLSPESSLIGGGVWHPETEAVRTIRDRIVSYPKDWQRVTADFRSRSGSKMAGESLQRPPAGYDPNHPLIEDLKRKDFTLFSPLTQRDVCGSGFPDLLLENFRSMNPFVEFLTKAIGLR
jgi:uncharacterized protein (TIGR02453 family)